MVLAFHPASPLHGPPTNMCRRVRRLIVRPATPSRYAVRHGRSRRLLHHYGNGRMLRSDDGDLRYYRPTARDDRPTAAWISRRANYEPAHQLLLSSTSQRWLRDHKRDQLRSCCLCYSSLRTSRAQGRHGMGDDGGGCYLLGSYAGIDVGASEVEESADDSGWTDRFRAYSKGKYQLATGQCREGQRQVPTIKRFRHGELDQVL